jgi:hypothetical protein
MNNLCEHGEKIVNGMNIYILCLLTNSPCSFQRYCTSRQDVLNTEGAKNCVGRTKKLIVENEVQTEKTDDVVVDEVDINENFVEFVTDAESETEIVAEKVDDKKFGTVFLISKSGVYYNYNDQSRYMTGKFNVKIGDKIEV